LTSTALASASLKVRSVRDVDRDVTVEERRSKNAAATESFMFAMAAATGSITYVRSHDNEILRLLGKRTAEFNSGNFRFAQI
jgi:hypothetical protein